MLCLAPSCGADQACVLVNDVVRGLLLTNGLLNACMKEEMSL